MSDLAAMELFDDGALVLRLTDRQLFELNETAREVLLKIDGARSVSQVASVISRANQMPEEDTLADVTEIMEKFVDQGILEKKYFVDFIKKESGMTEGEYKDEYSCNPDVVLREEDEDGGLLFNPDSNQVKVINSTGLYIWKQFRAGSKVPAIVTGLLDAFEDAPADKVADDVKEFIEAMVQTGFIGVVQKAV